MSKIKLSFGQLNIAALAVGAIGALFTGFGGGFAAGAGGALAAGLPFGKAVVAGVIAGGTAGVTAAGGNVAGFFTQRTKGSDGSAPLLPSLESTDTSDLGATMAAKAWMATGALAQKAPVDPELVALKRALERYEDPVLVSIAAIYDERQQRVEAQARETEAQALRDRLAAIEKPATTATA